MTKNEKISKGLKRHYRNKKVKRDIKRLLWFILFVAIISQFTPYKLQAPKAVNQNALPIAEDREMSVVELIDVISKEEGHHEWSQYIKKLSFCESRLDPNATNSEGNTPAYSKDRGLLQINDYWHPSVSDECAYNPSCAIRYTIKMIEEGRQSEWVCDKYVKGVPIEIVMK